MFGSGKIKVKMLDPSAAGRYSKNRPAAKVFLN
jgi:hypothetical protein